MKRLFFILLCCLFLSASFNNFVLAADENLCTVRLRISFAEVGGRENNILKYTNYFYSPPKSQAKTEKIWRALIEAEFFESDSIDMFCGGSELDSAFLMHQKRKVDEEIKKIEKLKEENTPKGKPGVGNSKSILG